MMLAELHALVEAGMKSYLESLALRVTDKSTDIGTDYQPEVLGLEQPDP